MEKIKTIRLDRTDSTNRFLHEYEGEEGELLTVVTAEYQTAGRGQGSNTWESEAGSNLMFSIKMRPKRLNANRQFVLLEAVALAIRDALSAYADGFTVKWPNDVYWHDRKISGTLSECRVSGRMTSDCISGTGININQQKFVSDAPNPVSLRNIIGRDTDREEILCVVICNVKKYLDMVNTRQYALIDGMYAAALYRKTGTFEYEDEGGRFTAEIERIEPDGHLVLRRTDGQTSRYAFKEVKFIIGRVV